MKAYHQVEFKDLTPDLEILSDVIGIENVRLLIEKVSGVQFRIPRLPTLNGFCRKYIKNNIEKSNMVLAFELDSSDNFVRLLKIQIKKEEKDKEEMLKRLYG
ncbi:hypothetical protein LCGC14_0342160 [marine sediment metagenome]|uniref:Uncharacterized protein n=1 Tax=marine sediment metagenome TaxID=412755 RepID=A0A0F9TIV9_9ZZZZ